MSFACNIILSGPRIPFSTQSSYIQSDFAKRFLSVAHQISCGDATSLFNYCIFRSRQGKPIRKALVRSYMESAELPLLENVRKMHSACKSRPGTSSSVLALVSSLAPFFIIKLLILHYMLMTTIEQLSDFGFEFSSNQYSLSRKKASEENFTMVDYKRHSSTSKKKASEETKAKVSDILYEFSNSSSSTISLGTAGNGYQEIRYLTKPKRDIYYELKEKHPEIQLSLSKFYSLCPNNYRKPQKRTDVCNICAAGEKIKKKYDTTKANENASLEQTMRLRVATEEFEVHKQLTLEQRKNFKNQIAGLSGKSLIIISDFKENFKIGGGPIETTRDFYQKPQISDLCFCVLSKSGDLVRVPKVEEVNLWSDSGPHFKNADYLYSVCLELPQIFSSKKFKLNYFMENHGKSDVDGRFGVLSREKSQVSDNISDNNRVYNFQIYRKDAIRGLRIRAKVSSGFRNYLSFYLGDGGLMACPLSLPDPSKCFNIDFMIKVKRDIRTNK
ncbi:hypothetical protein BB560_004579 [Smittium megazygosporum]|uniref:Uncharacterized protein n=1 Tax=Smittium megazygosporum TaxID=133381 RepID=A0A2T9Z8W6_9FUNG|nr:hypothetical protein BB560_004579 [Smittium megazygosporum]